MQPEIRVSNQRPRDTCITREPSAGRKPATRAKDFCLYNKHGIYLEHANGLDSHSGAPVQGRRPEQPAGGAGLGVLDARKTARAPVLMAETWVRTPSIRRTGPFRTPCEAATSATADAACLGCGSATRTVVRPCVVRLSLVTGNAHARWCSPFAAICWAEALAIIAAEAGRSLGPMFPASAWECWPFCVLRDSCHAALLG
jgi:hypothetical protein